MGAGHGLTTRATVRVLLDAMPLGWDERVSVHSCVVRIEVNHDVLSAGDAAVSLDGRSCISLHVFLPPTTEPYTVIDAHSGHDEGMLV